MAERVVKAIEIFPPAEPLEYPLSVGTVAKILGITSETLRAWEEKGRIPEIPQGSRGTKMVREYRPKEVMAILSYMQQATFPWNKNRFHHPWLQGIDLNKPGEKITTPTGYVIKIEPID